MESSGNSGSLHSSGGGDEENDSRAAAALSIFMNTRSPSHRISTPTPPPLLEPVLSNYIPNASSLNPISTPWPRPTPATMMGSDPNPSSSHATIFAENNDHLRSTAAARRSRKRSRATRRDPTTVLTTDTTNFRAMVQEFTGIPSPPFNTSSSFDLFRTRTRSTHFEPPYLRRPSAQKVESPPPPFLVSSSTTPINYYQLPMPMQLIQSSNLFNDLQNPNTTLTSLLQSNPRFLNAAIPTNEFGDDFDFNLDEDHQCFTALSGLPNLISPDKNSQSYNYREIKTTAVCGGSNGKMPAAFKGDGMVESWITSSE